MLWNLFSFIININGMVCYDYYYYSTSGCYYYYYYYYVIIIIIINIDLSRNAAKPAAWFDPIESPEISLLLSAEGILVNYNTQTFHTINTRFPYLSADTLLLCLLSSIRNSNNNIHTYSIPVGRFMTTLPALLRALHTQ